MTLGAQHSARTVPTASTSLRPDDSSRWGVRHAFIAYVAGTVLSFVFFSAAGGTADDPTVWTHLAGLAGLWTGLIGGVWIASRKLGSDDIAADFKLRVAFIDVPIGIIVGLALQLLAVPLVSWPVEHFGDADIEGPARELLDISGPRWLLYALLVIGAPIVEELFFRGLLLRSLARRFNDVAAIGFCSALFAATHFQLAQFPGLFVVGLGFALLVKRSGRLGPAIIAHMAFNATAVWIVL